MATVHSTADLESENQRLRRAIQELGILNDLARAIGGLADPDEIIKSTIRSSLKALPSEQGTITLLTSRSAANPPGASRGNIPAHTLVREMGSGFHGSDLHLTQALLGWMLLNRQPLIINDPGNDQRFGAFEWDPEIRSLLCVPLMIKSELIGILTIYNDRSGAGFSEDDQRLLAIIGAESAQIIENARLHDEEKAMQDQVRLAGEIQQHLLPRSLSSCDGYTFSATSVAALVVGGDYYDFIPLKNDCCAICLGDVSGKGLPAALVMANVQATIRLLAGIGVSPSDAMAQANDLLAHCTPTEKFVTFFYSILDQRRGELRFCNAGHNPPLLVRGSEVRRLRTRGMVLGVIEGFDYEEATEQLQPGDLVVIFSDGVTEAINQDEIEFGEQRLADLLVEHRREPVETIKKVILDAITAHAGGRPQNDDITLAILKREDEA